MSKLLKRSIDVSLRIRPGMVVYPGECETKKEMHLVPGAGNPITCSHWSFTAHVGTHLDAPRHFVPRGKAISDYPPDYFEFRAAVLDATRLRTGRRHVDAPFLAANARLLSRADAILFKTHNGALWRKRRFDPGHTAVGHDASAAIAEAGKMRLVGIDYFSVEPNDAETFETHLALLRKGILILEGLDLSRVKAGVYTLLCPPLLLEDTEAAPCRAVLVPR